MSSPPPTLRSGGAEEGPPGARERHAGLHHHHGLGLGVGGHGAPSASPKTSFLAAVGPRRQGSWCPGTGRRWTRHTGRANCPRPSSAGGRTRPGTACEHSASS